MPGRKDNGIRSMKDLPKDVAESAEEAGMDKVGKMRSASFFHLDEAKAFSKVMEEYRGSVEILDIKEALEKYKWLSGHYWKLVDREKDEYTKKAGEKLMGGYFIRILPGKKIPVPLQACMFISKQGFTQYVHNIIIAEEGSEAQIISGCAATEDAGASEHIGISEFYVKKDAKLTFTMIHNWNKDMKIRPRSAAIVEDNATFSSNYVILKPVKDLQMYPETILAGRNSVARSSNLMYAEKDSRMDVGSKVVLTGNESRAEIISRAIAKDDSKIIARGILEGENPTIKAHLECRGLLLGKKAMIHAIPELVATGEGAEMSHEAAVGKIAEKEILYLMSRKLTREDATSLIIRGFLDTKILHLPPALEDTIKNMTEKVAEGL